MRNAAILILALLLDWGACAATIVWTNTAGGFWSAANNWNPHQVPTAADDVFITNNGTYTVTLDIWGTNNALTLGGASGTQTFIISSPYTLNGPGTVNANGTFNLPSATTLAGTGDLTVSGLFQWSNGTLGG
ncbi:MAG: hypothetical protein NTW03_07260, partial [Verrucomicrobia bacterium]|nr:hypothetical protein [Verrucomicrobiota bacterium]